MKLLKLFTPFFAAIPKARSIGASQAGRGLKTVLAGAHTHGMRATKAALKATKRR